MLAAMTKFSKAIAGAVFAGGTALGTAALDAGVSTNEWWGILAAALVTGAGVYYVPNA